MLSSCNNDESYYYVTDYEVSSLYRTQDYIVQKEQAQEKLIGLKILPNEIQVTAYDMCDKPIIFPEDTKKGIEIERTITFVKTSDRHCYEYRKSSNDKYVLRLDVHSGEEDSITGGDIREIKGCCVKFIRFEKNKRVK